MCYSSAMDREHDIRLIESELRDPQMTPARRARLMEQLKKIRNESPAIREMRRHLIKAHRENNQEEINDIRDFVNGNSKYSND